MFTTKGELIDVTPQPGDKAEQTPRAKRGWSDETKAKPDQAAIN
jgi:hypothetical protein